jgi:molybdopterin converting factor small subunit
MKPRTIRIELHARAGELAGARVAALELPAAATCADLKAALARAHPALGGLLAACAVATERDYLAEGASLGDGDRFHLIPPVSGG